MLFSNDRSKPDISVPISVTERTPITIPKAVKIDLVLFANTEDKDIFRFSKNLFWSDWVNMSHEILCLVIFVFRSIFLACYIGSNCGNFGEVYPFLHQNIPFEISEIRKTIFLEMHIECNVSAQKPFLNSVFY